MTKSRLKSLCAAVTAAGLKYSIVDDGIVVDTNYIGSSPPKETWDKISLLDEMCRRRKLSGETRGYYTGYYIREMSDYRNTVLSSK
ncbi:MAG: hypothetical protein RR365_14795 [Bacteroides sp.]